MKIYCLKFEHQLPVGLNVAWDFFSSPLNLAKITPTYMRFTVTSGFAENQKMYPGMIISYKVSPLLGIKLNWATEITHVKEHEYFVDEQRFGPFALWHHEHHFKEIPTGVQMTDILYYAVPFGFIGRMANAVVVKNNIMEIFAFREKKINGIFGCAESRF